MSWPLKRIGLLGTALLVGLIALAPCALVGCSSGGPGDDSAISTDSGRESESESETSEVAVGRVEIPGVGSICVPDELEVQGQAYRDMKEELIGSESDTFIIQQRGLNEGTADAFDTYARIMVDCDQGQSGDYPVDDFDPSYYSDSDIAAMDEILETELYSQMSAAGMEVLAWHPISFKTVAGHQSLKMSYVRAGDGGQTTEVSMYALPCDDRLVRVTLSYRTSDADRWEALLLETLETLEVDC